VAGGGYHLTPAGGREPVRRADFTGVFQRASREVSRAVHGSVVGGRNGSKVRSPAFVRLWRGKPKSKSRSPGGRWLRTPRLGCYSATPPGLLVRNGDSGCYTGRYKMRRGCYILQRWPPARGLVRSDGRVRLLRRHARRRGNLLRAPWEDQDLSRNDAVGLEPPFVS